MLTRKDRFDRELEHFGKSECELQAGVVFAALDVADRLVVHADGLGQLLTREVPLSAQDGDAVMQWPLSVSR